MKLQLHIERLVVFGQGPLDAAALSAALQQALQLELTRRLSMEGISAGLGSTVHAERLAAPDVDWPQSLPSHELGLRLAQSLTTGLVAWQSPEGRGRS